MITQPYATSEPTESPPPRRKKRVFLWIFLGIQLLFIIWLIVGISSKNPSHAAEVAKSCGNGGWQGLFSSHADCMKHYAVAINDATNTGKGLGAALVVIVWIVVDFFVSLGYGIYRLARRPARS